jgi:hypothetical protein
MPLKEKHVKKGKEGEKLTGKWKEKRKKYVQTEARRTTGNNMAHNDYR